MSASRLTKKHLQRAIEVLAAHDLGECQEALNQLTLEFGFLVSRSQLNRRLNKELGHPMSFFLKAGASVGSQLEYSSGDYQHEDIQRLVKVVKNGPITIEELCDKLQVWPDKAKDLLKKAAEAGVRVKVSDRHIGLDNGVTDEVTVVTPAPPVGELQKVAVISDTHYGSKYCLRHHIQDFIDYAYDEHGVREVLHPGDVLDGCYRHGVYELTHHGLDEQTEDLFEHLPERDGLKYHCITGNHDETFTSKVGVDVGHHIEAAFRRNGREDVKFHGNRGAFLSIRGALVHLWHPRSGKAYARSYHLQKNLDEYVALKPQVLLAGHWHMFCHVFERGVHALACPSFQGGQSSYGKSLPGSPAIGGLILSWQTTEQGTIRRFNVDTYFYFEREKIFEARNRVDGLEIPPHVSKTIVV